MECLSGPGGKTVKKVNPLSLVHFLSAIFQPFSHVTEEQRQKMTEELFGKKIKDKILSELKQSYKNIYCDGEKYLTPSIILSAIEESAGAWKEKDFFVINTIFNRNEDQLYFRKELVTLFSDRPKLQAMIPFSIRKINQKYLQESNKIYKLESPKTIWNLYQNLNSYHIDWFSSKTNFAINIVEVCNAITLAKSVLEITDGEFLKLFLTSIALCKSDDLFYDELLKTSSKAAQIRYAFATLFENKLRFSHDQSCNDQTFPNKLINKLKDRHDLFIIFAELIDCCERIGTDKKICQTMVEAIFCFIEKYIADTERYSKSLKKLLVFLYQFSSMKSIGYFINFHSNEIIESKLLNEIMKFYVPKITPENLSAFNISNDSLNVLIKGFTFCYKDKQRLSLFSKLNKTFIIYFEKEKSQAISISSNIAILNLLTIEFLTYDSLISAGHEELMTKVTNTWKIFEQWLPNWDFALFIHQNEIYPKIYSIFKCNNYKSLIEKTLFNLNNRPFPLINLIALIFHLHPDLKDKYSFFLLDYYSRYKNYWDKERIRNLRDILKFAGLKEPELENNCKYKIPK